MYKLDDGRFVGPFGALLHTPGPDQHFLGMANTLAQIPGLTPRNREIAIIVREFNSLLLTWVRILYEHPLSKLYSSFY